MRCCRAARDGLLDRRAACSRATAETRQGFRKMLREGELDDKEIEIEVRRGPAGVEIMAPPGMEEMTEQLQGMFANLGGSRRASAQAARSREALKLLIDEEAAQARQRRRDRSAGARQRRAERHRLHRRDRQDRAPRRKRRAPTSRARACSATCCRWSRARTVNTKYGMVKTDHILFIASGAFHLVKPSDLIPELQGRFPIRVELDSLSVDDFERILTEPRRLAHRAVPGAARRPRA